jgi:hypothetical protein
MFVDDFRSRHKVELDGTDIETYLKEVKQGKEHYKSMKVWYEAAYAMHKKRRASS